MENVEFVLPVDCLLRPTLEAADLAASGNLDTAVVFVGEPFPFNTKVVFPILVVLTSDLKRLLVSKGIFFFGDVNFGIYVNIASTVIECLPEQIVLPQLLPTFLLALAVLRMIL